MKNLFLTLTILGSTIMTAFTPSDVEAIKIKVEPSFTIQDSHRPYHQPTYTRYDYNDVYYYVDPYTHREYYYTYPVRYERVEYRPYYRSHSHRTGTDFKLKFKIK